MLKRVFITGTDTAVGKTVVSRALLQALVALFVEAVGEHAKRQAEKNACGHRAR